MLSGDINVEEVKFLVNKYFVDIELGLVLFKWEVWVFKCNVNIWEVI